MKKLLRQMLLGRRGRQDHGFVAKRTNQLFEQSDSPAALYVFSRETGYNVHVCKTFINQSIRSNSTHKGKTRLPAVE